MAEALGYLYVIGETDSTEEVKIGRSVNPMVRRTQLQVGRGKRLVVHGSWSVPRADAVRLEAACHDALKSVRVKGEVFTISPDLACAFVEHIAHHGEADDFLRLGLSKDIAERRWGRLSTLPSASGRWLKPEAAAAADAAEAEMKRLTEAFFAMDQARADRIDPSRLFLEKLG